MPPLGGITPLTCTIFDPTFCGRFHSFNFAQICVLDSYRPEVIGLKTGNSSLSGACLISAAVINGETYICVMMRSTKDARFQDSVDIYDEIKNQ